jgi:hypothetical protein
LKVLYNLIWTQTTQFNTEFKEGSWQARVRGSGAPGSPERQARQSNMV